MMTLSELRYWRLAIERPLDSEVVVSSETIAELFDDAEITKRNLADARQRLVDLELDLEVGG